jgi:cyclopropane fatty-acyl-phospholipid synthase-like methyltransferase
MTELWDNVWRMMDHTNLGMRLHHHLVFTAYERMLDPLSLRNPAVLELGAGPGELTARIIKKYGGTATLVDKSAVAVRLAKMNFSRHTITARIFQRDLLDFRPSRKYDLVHSEGLIEHFIGKEQKAVITAHKRCAKRDGFLLFCVPRPAWYYRVVKKFLEKAGKWPWGFEQALEHTELRQLLEDNGLHVLRSANYVRYALALAKL